MAEFDSPLGKKQFPNQSRKVFNVPDEDAFSPAAVPEMQPGIPVELSAAQFQEMQQRKMQIKQSQGKATSESRQRVEVLTGIGRLTKDISIEGRVFTLQSLKSREMRETIKAVSQATDGADSIFEMRAQILARSIIKIDGHPIGLVLGNDSLESKLTFIDESEESTVNQLYTGYTEMTKKTDLAVKTVEDAREIAEEIKK